jgi:hypothetical protein
MSYSNVYVDEYIYDGERRKFCYYFKEDVTAWLLYMKLLSSFAEAEVTYCIIIHSVVLLVIYFKVINSNENNPCIRQVLPRHSNRSVNWQN